MRKKPRHHSTAECKVIATAVIVEGGRVLLVRQGKGRSRGLWNLPGGTVGPWESLHQALCRETREETGLKVEPAGLLGVYHYVNRKQIRAMRVAVVCRVKGGRPRPGGPEIRQVGWYTPAQVRAMGDRRLKNPLVLRRILVDLARVSRHPRKKLHVLEAVAGD